MPASLISQTDPVPLQPPGETPAASKLKIGIHTSTCGGCETAARRAFHLGCNTFQIFSSSPRQWKPYALAQTQCDEMRRLRHEHSIAPLVIHCSYLVNLASTNPEFLQKSIVAFRGELERALALGAEYLVLHPGSFRGSTHQDGLDRITRAIAQAAAGLDCSAAGVTILIENSAGYEYSLGSTFEQVAELIGRLAKVIPVASCMDTCHLHVAGHDIISAEGMESTLQKIDATVGLANIPVWHCNDAKAPMGSRLDRHQHIGQGTIGIEPFSRLLNDPRLAHAAFIAETPIDQPGDDFRNVNSLKSVVKDATRPA